MIEFKQTSVNKNLIEIENLIGIYRSLSPLLNEVGNPTLERLTTSWDSSLPQLQEGLESFSSNKEYRLAKNGLRQGLKELPKLIASINGLDHAQLITSIESKLNLRFSDL